MRRLAVLSLHTSPLAQPGSGDGGGMNVYVRELSSALARAGVRCDVFTRAWSPDLPESVMVEPGFRVHHVPTGDLAPMAKEALPSIVDEFTEGVLKRMARADWSDWSNWSASAGGAEAGENPAFDAVHANYWLSGLSGHVIKHELNVPLVSTFHTLDRVKAEASPEEVEANESGRRAEAEASIIQCSDTVLASCSVEAEQIVALYGADPSPHPHRGPRRGPRLLRSRLPPAGPKGAGLCRRGAPVVVRRPHPAAEGGRRRRADPRRAQ